MGWPSAFIGFFQQCVQMVCSFLKIIPSRGQILYCYLKIQNRISGSDFMTPVFERFTCFSNNTFDPTLWMFCFGPLLTACDKIASG